jgi:hypothetical protein
MCRTPTDSSSDQRRDRLFGPGYVDLLAGDDVGVYEGFDYPHDQASSRPTSPTATTPSSKPYSPTSSTDPWPICPRDASAPTPPGSCARRSPTTCCMRRSARRRPTHPGTGIDATPQDCHRPGPAGPTPAPTDPAPAHPLALVETLACTMAQHDWTSAATACDTLTTRRQAQPQRTGKAGQTSRDPMPTTRKTASTNPDTTQLSTSVDRG